MKESMIEAKLVKGIQRAGGLCYKFTSPGNPGVPDRVIILPGGRVVFAELKTEVGRLSSIQRWQTGELRARGAEVRVLKGMEQVQAFLEEVTADGVHPA